MLRALLAEHGKGRGAEASAAPVRGLARLLRRNPTDAERALWDALIRTAASPATASSARRRSGRMSPTWCRSRCAWWSNSVPPDEGEAARRTRAERRAWLAERGYRVIELAAEEVEADVAEALDRLHAALSASVPSKP